MDRKQFLSSIAGLGAVYNASGKTEKRKVPEEIIIPPYLTKGDTIAITSPAGYITQKEIEPAIQQINSWGLKVKIGATIGRKNFNFGGTDTERRNDMQHLLDDPMVKAIMCARGGYGVIRIIDGLNFSRFIRKPKWIVGFSDVTVLHAHVNSNFGIASIHSKMCNSFPDKWNQAEELQKETIISIRDALMGAARIYDAVPSVYNKRGTAEGVVVGGNLKLIESIAGSRSDLYTNGRILFVEDAGEYLYSIDRMFWNLKRSGKLVGLKGLIVGGFRIKPDDPGEEFGIPLQNIVLDIVKEYKFPVCFDFPVGHQVNNFAIKCGAPYRLSVQQQSCTLEEINTL